LRKKVREQLRRYAERRDSCDTAAAVRRCVTECCKRELVIGYSGPIRPS